MLGKDGNLLLVYVFADILKIFVVYTVENGLGQGPAVQKY